MPAGPLSATTSRLARALFGAYVPVLRAPGAGRLAVGGLVGRIREGGISLAIVLGVRAASGSFATAGLAAAAFFLCAAVARPLQGRRADRSGKRAVLLAMTCANAAALLLLAAALVARVPDALLLAICGLTGATQPALSATLRALWPAVAPAHRESAYALDTLLYEVSLVVSPVMVGTLATLVSPALALLALAACGTAGTLLVASASASASADRGSPRPRPVRGARVLTSAFVLLALMTLCIGFAEGSLTVIVPAFAAGRHATPSSGLLLSALSAGSLLGGLAYGPFAGRGSTGGRLVATTAALTAGCVALASGVWATPTFAVLLALIGMAVSPTLTGVFIAVERATSSRALTEAFAWISLAAPAGISGAQALAGVLVSHSGLSLACWQPAAGAGVALALAGLFSMLRPMAMRASPGERAC
jgi:MFS family permease